MNLKRKKVLITGAAKRIGKSIALAFAQRGADILVHYHQSKNEAEELAKEIEKLGMRCSLYSADLSKTEELLQLTQEIIEKEKSLDVLIHNASVFYPTPLPEVTEKDWDIFLDLHVKAPFFLAQQLAPLLKKSVQGRIINIADGSMPHFYPNYIPYCTSKAALITLTQSLAKVLAPEILVNAICPGLILPTPGMEESQNKIAVQETLSKKWGGAEEVAKMAIHLAESDFITGQNFVVGGGEDR